LHLRSLIRKDGEGGRPPATEPASSRLRLKPDELFQSDHLSHDLAGRTARGGLATIVSRLSQFVVQSAGIIVLARILTPADYGLVGMVTVFVGLAQVFKDGGLGMGTVQSEEISHEQVSTVFWLNVGLLLLVGLVVIAAAPSIAGFYRHPELAPVTAVLGAAFVVNGLSVQHDALLRRHMRFVAVAITQVVPLVLSLGVSIVLALAGWRYWSLVAGTVVTAAASTALSFYLCPWVPGWLRRRTGARRMVKFGRDLTIFNAFNYFARNFDNILIGRFVGAAALGLYSKAYSLFLLPMTQIRGPLSDVSMPALSSLKRQPERYARYYCTFLSALAYATVPISAYCVLEGDFLITTLLGSRWAAAGPVFRILAAAGILQTIASTRGLVLVSLGESRKYLWLGVINSVAMVIAFVLGVRFGIVGVATAYAAASLVVLVPTLLFTFAGTPVTIRMFFGVLLRPVAFAAVASAVSALVSVLVWWLAGSVGILGHVLALVAFFSTYALLASRSREFRDTWGAFAGRLLPTPRAASAEEGAS
jgi:O-antigen/teichoic acid export membrane protein